MSAQVTPATTAPVTPPAAAAPPAETTAPPPQASAKTVASAFFRSFGIPDKEVEKPVEKPAEKPTETPPATTTTTEPKEDKPKSKKADKKAADEVFDPNAPTPPRQQPKQDIDIKSLVKDAVSGALEAAKPKAAPEPKIELPRSVARKVEALQILEKQAPALKGISSKVESFYKPNGSEEQYKAEWMKANPGKKFSRDDADHDEWYADNDPLAQISEDDMELARELLIESKAVEIANKTVSKQIEKQETQEKLAGSKAKAKTAIDDMAIQAISGFSPEYAEKAKDIKNLVNLDKEDPLAEHVLISTVQRAAPVIEGVYDLWAGAGFDKKNPVHQEVERYGIELEDRLIALGDNARRGQKQFVPLEKFMGLTKSEQEKVWTITDSDLVKYIQESSKKSAAELYSRLGGGRSLVANNGQAPAAKPVEQKAVAAEVTSSSPSVSASASSPPPGTPVAPIKARASDAFFKAMGVR